MCYRVSKDKPETVEREPSSAMQDGDGASSSSSSSSTSLTGGVKAPDVLKGLDSFLLKPPGMKGVELFEHMLKRGRLSATDAGPHAKHRPSNALDVAISEENEKILSLTPQDFTLRNIMKDAGDKGATMKMVKRKLVRFPQLMIRLKLSFDRLMDCSNVNRTRWGW